MIDYLNKYIDENFRDFWSDINVRFELGAPFENGTDERINQVVYRVTTLFEETFRKDDSLYLYIKDWGGIDPIFGNTTPDYLYKLISHRELEEAIMYQNDEELDEEGNTIQIKIPYWLKVLSSPVSQIPYKDILRGIAHYEQGREPKIGQRVYFINTNEDIVFHMYDDRGCIIFSKSREKLKYLYATHNNWLVDDWREFFEDLFEE